MTRALEVVLREDAETICRIAAALSRGEVILGEQVSVGPWTPAVRSPEEEPILFAVLTRRAVPTDLLRDAFEAARAFVRLEAGGEGDVTEEAEFPLIYPTRAQPSDALLVARERWDNWFYTYRHDWSFPGDPDFDPPYPRQEDYP